MNYSLRCGVIASAVLFFQNEIIVSAVADSGLARHKQLYVVPAPGKVVIDGSLKDWNLSGQIEVYVVSESKDSQGAKFALMYDSDALYVSGVVRDTSPMMNRHDPKVDGENGWNADSCQFRLNVDPSQPYPVKDSVFLHQGPKATSDTNDAINHLTLWYYTDKEEPCLSIQKGMSYRVPQSCAPFGVVPADQFEAKYVKSEDGLGYTFEYRIPWTILGAKVPLKGGDVVGGTVGFNFGYADGFKAVGGAGWAYDLMCGPGFAFQDASVWGKLIFAAGSVSRDLVEAGVPKGAPKPLDFDYDLPQSGEITLQLVDKDKLVRRIIVAQGVRESGHHVEKWDGMDDHGQPLPAGTYKVEGIIHEPITEKFRFSVHNSGQPPYPTDDGKGGWGGDEGNPTACSSFPGGVLLSWDGAEYGWGIIRVDLDGHKQWGVKTLASLMVNDGKHFYIYLKPSTFNHATGIQVLDIADGHPLNFGNGKPYLEAPSGGNSESDDVTGLAYAAGKIYVSYEKRNLIAIFDSTSGDPEGTWTVPAPGAMAVREDGSLLAVSSGKLKAVVNGAVSSLNDDDIDHPAGITLDDHGKIYVSNQGQSQDISVLSPVGKLLKRIGKPGGRPAVGNYDANGVYQPKGLAIDGNGMLWVAEYADGPKRISVWNTLNSDFVREYFGGASYMVAPCIDPARPNEIYCNDVLWHIDWSNYTASPVSTLWRKTAPDMVEAPDSAYFNVITAKNGKQYGVNGGDNGKSRALYRREDNVFIPFAAFFSISHGWELWTPIGIPDLDDPAKTPDGSYFWQDVNGDGRVQTNEITRIAINSKTLALAPDMSIWTDNYVLKPSKWLPNNQPFYDPEKLEKNILAGKIDGADLKIDPDGNFYTLDSNGGQLSLWSADGQLKWGYPNLKGWHGELSTPLVKAGVLSGLTGGLGFAGDFTGNMTYFGPAHLFTREGIYTAVILRDGRVGGDGPDIGVPEGQFGNLVSVVTKPETPPRTFLLAGGQDGRVTEVLGLDTVKPLATTKFILTQEQIKLASDALSEYLSQLGGGQKLFIEADTIALASGAGVTQMIDDTRSFTVKVAYDSKNLIVSFDVISPSELINAQVDPKIIFKGGNLLDLQIATDPSADPQRKTPAPGDVRLLVTRQVLSDGTLKPRAVLFRPKIKDFKGQPILLTSPTGHETFDDINVVEGIGLDYSKTPKGFKALLMVPLNALGLTLEKGAKVKMDIGYIYGNATGTQTGERSYLYSKSFSSKITNDVPSESRLEPSEWNEVSVK